MAALFVLASALQKVAGFDETKVFKVSRPLSITFRQNGRTDKRKARNLEWTQLKFWRALHIFGEMCEGHIAFLN